MNIPFLSFAPAHQAIKPEIMQAFEHFYDKGWYILGDGVKAFEAEYAAFNQVQYCVGVSNGLDALHLALRTLNIGPGDEVIVPSNTYIASLLSISYVGATPVLVEPDEHTYNMLPANVEAAITSRTKAIMPVHLYGQCCEMEAIMSIADKHGLYVVEDNAQSQGAAFAGKPAGSWGHINGTSFYPGKNLGALGDAGAVTTNDEALAKRAAILRNYGSAKKYYNEEIGYNMRLDECQAVLLYIKLKHLEEWTTQRQTIAAWYMEALAANEHIVLPYTHPQASHVYHLFVVRCNKRDQLQQHLNTKGIGTLIHYPVPPHLQQAYASLGFGKGSFPLAEAIADTCLSLPMWPGMTQSMVAYIADSINQFS